MTVPCPRCRKALDIDRIVTGDVTCPHCSKSFEAVRFEPAAAHVAVIEMADGHTDAAQPCPTHPRNAAVASCERCGSFMCALCRIDVDSRTLCPSCFERLSAEGSLESSRTTFRDYAGLSSVSATAGCLIFYLGIILGPLAMYFGVKALKQKKESGDREGIVGIWAAMTIGALEIVGGLFLAGYLLVVFTK